MKDIWLPLYVDEYLGDTMHLSTEEHGAYLLLIMAYFKNRGPLPDCDKTLANICRLTPARFKKIKKTVTNFFQISEKKLIHKRLEKELAIAKAKKQERTAKAKKAAASRWSGDQKADATSNAQSNATSIFQASHGHTLEDTQSQSQSQYKKTPPPRAPTRDAVLGRLIRKGIPNPDLMTDKFWNHFESVGWLDHVGRPIARWENKLDNWILEDKDRAKHKQPAGKPAESKSERSARIAREMLAKASDRDLDEPEEPEPGTRGGRYPDGFRVDARILTADS